MDIEVERVHDEGPAVARRYALLGVLMPAFGKAGVAGERIRQIRDGTLVAIALEAYRKRNGMYPGSLDALVPGFLPAIPPDRYDGRALKYRLVGDTANAKPIVYSIGVDRVDDNGLGPVRVGNEINMTGYRGPATIKAWLARPQMALSYRGDWVLYDPGHLDLRLQEVKTPKQRVAHPRGGE